MQQVASSKYRRLDLNAHKHSPIVRNYLAGAFLFQIPQEKITNYYMPYFANLDFYVTHGDKIVGFMIRGHFVKHEIK